MTVSLSICIPTYNRAVELRATLEALAAQWQSNLELVIADNASTDNTEELVHEYAARIAPVRYHRWSVNQGPDRNFLKAAELATGTYCWLLGSDDLPAPGAIHRLLALVEERSPTILLFERLLCSRDLSPQRHDRYFEPTEERTYDFANTGVLEGYLGSAKSVCAAFTYLSSMVFQRSAWNAVEADLAFDGSVYSHTYQLLSMCARGATLRFVPEALVLCRLGNDSFRDRGLARRTLLDLEGFDLLAQRCFLPERAECARRLRALLRHEYPFARVMRYHGILSSDPSWPVVVQRLRTTAGYDPWRLGLALLLGRIPPIVRLSFRLRDWRAGRLARHNA